MSLISRNGYDRTEAFGAPFAPLAAAGHELIIDGEIAVPDDRGVTHLDFLNDAIDLDPATHPIAQQTVRAISHYTAADDWLR